MLKNRLIAVILLRRGQVVQSVRFKHTNIIHYDPIHAVESFNRWAVDEIVLLDVTREKSGRPLFLDALDRISSQCFVPLSAGGWVADPADARELLSHGADKVVVNTQAFQSPRLVTELAGRFGSQCVVVSIDAVRDGAGDWQVVVDRGRSPQPVSAVDWAKRAVDLGAGELFVNSLEHDGNRKGYALDLIRAVGRHVNAPVIAMGGVFTWEHLALGIEEAGADAVAAANIFHYTEQSTKKAKQYLIDRGHGFRAL
ncbi:MAG: imidazole glycerol phosphate synthase subunit HisF [Desulfobacter sp.]|nr:MAG: imidazole glycerol phosphate synthase subunit HisF [Desulfobacter sp.]